MVRSRPFGRDGQLLFFASTLCTVTSNIGFASALEQKPYVLMDMYQPISASKNPYWQWRGIGNENMYDIGGLLRFLYTEVLGQEGKDPERPSRGHGIDRINVWHLKVFNPPNAVKEDHQWEFAPYMRFKDGALVDTDGGLLAETALERLADLGDQIGLQAFREGSADPRLPWDGTYYEFSVPGPCPNLKETERGILGMDDTDPRCLRYKAHGVDGDVLKGAMCKVTRQDPDGSHGCVVVVEDVEIIDLDKLTGIREQDCGGRPCEGFADFHKHCTDPSLQFIDNGQRFCREYYAHPDCSSCSSKKTDCKAVGDTGLEFWRGRCNVTRNFERSQAIIASLVDGFKQMLRRYASSPSCSKYPGCHEPNAEKGTGYCHRTHSGVCEWCFVPGTINATSSLTKQTRCRPDLFTGEEWGALSEYKHQQPVCSVPCSEEEECSLATPEKACCVYIDKCDRKWKVDDTWSACSSKCGEGTTMRKVWCPWAEFGGCKEEMKPSVSKICYGKQCPWDSDSGAWEPCDNPCGQGRHSKRLVCRDGGDRCANAETPRPVERQCYGTSTRHNYCRQCSKDGLACTQCLDLPGFRLFKGYCVNTYSFVEVSFHVMTAAGRLLERSDIFAFLESAMASALSDMEILARVIDMSVVDDDTTNSGNALVRMALALPRTVLEGMAQADYQETLAETVAALSKLKVRVDKMQREGRDKKQREGLRSKIANHLQRQFSAGLSAILALDLLSVSFKRFCPELREWIEAEQRCAETPRFLLSDDGDQASGDSGSAYQQQPAQAVAYEGSQREDLAVAQSHGEEKVVHNQEFSKESSSPHVAESRKEHKLLVWAIAGGSLGCALATGLTIIVAVARRKRGSTNEANAFAKLARG